MQDGLALFGATALVVRATIVLDLRSVSSNGFPTFNLSFVIFMATA